MPDRLPEIWNKVRHGPDSGIACEAIARSLRVCRCRCLRSAIDQRHARHLRAARHQAARAIRFACESDNSSQLYLLEMARETDWFVGGDIRNPGHFLSSSFSWAKIAA